MTVETAKPIFLAYAKDRVPTGPFLKAVLENDLFGALKKADPESKENLVAICNWVFWELPAPCWGSPAKVANHLKTPEPDLEPA